MRRGTTGADVDTSDAGFVCPFCGPADEASGEPRRCGTCGRRCDEGRARSAREAWGRGTATLRATAPPLVRPHETTTPELVLVVARSPVTAVLLSLVWLGAGHVYVGRRRAGAALAAANLLLWLASGLGAPPGVTVTAWAVAACASAASSARAARTAPSAVFRA